jgi:hypothetical protein
MKQAKMRPNGRLDAVPWADWRAADQKKTKRYMEDSKAVVTSVRTRTWGDARVAEIEGGGGAEGSLGEGVREGVSP